MKQKHLSTNSNQYEENAKNMGHVKKEILSFPPKDFNTSTKEQKKEANHSMEQLQTDILPSLPSSKSTQYKI